jgi:hypothetical protein
MTDITTDSGLVVPDVSLESFDPVADALVGTDTNDGYGLRVSGTDLTLDGHIFYPVGWNSVAALYATPNSLSIEYQAAFDQFTNTCNSLVQWGANIVRLQVVQNVLVDTVDMEPVIIGDSTITAREAYIDLISGLVGIAEGVGLCVILCMMDELPIPAGSLDDPSTAQHFGYIDHTNYYSGGSYHWVNTGQTTAAWKALAAAFKNDPMVMFELFNESHLGLTGATDPIVDADWSLWQSENQGLIDTIRGVGAPNICIAGGHDKDKAYSGCTSSLLLTDSTGYGIAYAVHPYNYYSGDPADWTTNWGWVSEFAPMLATEWYATDKSLIFTTTADFLSFVSANSIGLLAWVFDNIHDPTSSGDQLLGHPTRYGNFIPDTDDFSQPWEFQATPCGTQFMEWMIDDIAALTFTSTVGADASSATLNFPAPDWLVPGVQVQLIGGTAEVVTILTVSDTEVTF